MTDDSVAIEKLHARCDALEAVIDGVIKAIIGKLPDEDELPNPAAFLEHQFRAAADNSRNNGGHPAGAELLDRWAEWMAMEKA